MIDFPSSSTLQQVATRLGVSLTRAAEILSVLEEVKSHTLSKHEPFEHQDIHAGNTLHSTYLDEPTMGAPTPSAYTPAQGTHSETRTPVVIADRYEELGLLGRGGIGEVRRVLDRRFDRILAMKVMRRDRFGIGLPTGLFLHEARIEARLQHPGVPPVYDHGILPDGRPWYTMKEVDGDRLDDLISRLHDARDAPDAFALRLRQLMRVFAAACSTVAFAHERGILHRDLKPDNIMVGAFGEVLVLDWGLACPTELPDAGSPNRGRIVGTPAYMSPEQAQGAPASLQSSTDIYGLGAVLYQILVGTPPYTGDSATAVLQLVASRVKRPMSPAECAHSEQIPLVLSKLCMTALAEAPEARPAGAQELADSVQDWLDTAERQDRGRHQAERALELSETAGREKRQGWTIWREASVLLDEDAGPSAPGWTRWHAAHLHLQAAEDLDRQVTQTLHAALAHSTDLPSAHEQLALRYSRDAQLARLRGAHQQAHVAAQKVRHHLDSLPSPRSSVLRQQIDRADRDALTHAANQHGAVVGRHELLTKLGRLAAETGRVVSLHGAPGVGKSALLVSLGITMRDDGATVIYLDRGEFADTAGLVHAVQRSMASTAPTAGAHHTSRAYRDAKLPVLLLDNIDPSRDDLPARIASWRQEHPHLSVVSTSRTPLEGAQTALVPPLQRLAAIELFCQKAREIDPSLDLDTLDRSALVSVVQSLMRVPIAIGLAATQLASSGLATLAARLMEPGTNSGFDALGHHGLGAAMALSWNGLSRNAQETLLQTSVFPGSFDQTAADQLVQVYPDGARVRESLEELTQSHLLRIRSATDGPLRHTHPQAVRAWALARLRSGGSKLSDFDDLVQRHAAYFAGLRTLNTSAPLTPIRRSLELENFLFAARNGPLTAAISCAHLACSVLTTQGPLSTSFPLLEQLLLRSDLDTGQRRSVLVLLGRCLRAAGRIEEARERIEQSRMLSADTASHGATGGAAEQDSFERTIEEHLTKALLAVDSHDTANARTQATKALVLAETTNNLMLQARAHAVLCVAPPPREGVDAARSHFEAALLLAEATGAEEFIRNTVGHYGRALFRRQRLPEALACFEQAEARHRQADNHRDVAACTMNQGIVLQRLGRPDEARSAFERAGASAALAKDERIQAAVQGAAASLAIRRGRYAWAHQQATEALQWQLRHGDWDKAQQTRRLLLAICIDQGQVAGARRHLTALEKAGRANANPSEAAFLAINRAILQYSCLGEPEAACAGLEAVAAEAEAANLDNEHTLALLNLGEARSTMGDSALAKQAFEAALRASGGRFPELSAVGQSALAAIAAKDGALGRAKELLAESSPHLEGWAVERIAWLVRSGHVAMHAGELLEALSSLQQAMRLTRKIGLGQHSPIRASLRSLERALDQRRAHLKAAIEPDAIPEHTESATLRAALLALSRILLAAGELTDAELMLNRIAESADQDNDTADLSVVASRRMLIARARGQYDTLEAEAERALDLARDLDDETLQANTLLALCSALQEKGELERAQPLLQQAQAQALQAEDPGLQALVLSSLGQLEFLRGNYAEAAEDFRRAGEIFFEIGLETQALQIRGNLGLVLMHMGHLQEAAIRLEAAVGSAVAQGSPAVRGACLTSLAEVRARQGDHETASQLLATAGPLVESEPLHQALFWCTCAVVCALSGADDEARRHLTTAEAGAARLGMTPQSELWMAFRRARETVSKASAGTDTPA